MIWKIVFQTFGVEVESVEYPAKFDGIDDSSDGVIVKEQRNVSIFLGPKVDVVNYCAHADGTD